MPRAPRGDVGLGYVTLGQPLSTFSGGERQRLRLAFEGTASEIVQHPTSVTGRHLAMRMTAGETAPRGVGN